MLLVGSDAGPDRIGTRADTLVVAHIDTRTGRTVLFGLPRNLGYAQFPPDSAIAEEFPDGFHDPSNPSSPDYLLNAVYTYGNEHPDLAPADPSEDAGLNLLLSSVSYMLGLDIDYYVRVNMQGFASIIDALGGLDVDVGPEPIPMGGIGLHGEAVRPFGYIPPGRQHLNGDQALWFARSRTNTTDYARMGRQRCLIQFLVEQKSPADVLSNFRSVAIATTSNVDTNVPQNVLPALAKLADKPKGRALESISFDPSLPDPNEPNGFFNTGRADVDYMREVVRTVLDPGSVAASRPDRREIDPVAQPAQHRSSLPAAGYRRRHRRDHLACGHLPRAGRRGRACIRVHLRPADVRAHPARGERHVAARGAQSLAGTASRRPTSTSIQPSSWRADRRARSATLRPRVSRPAVCRISSCRTSMIFLASAACSSKTSPPRTACCSPIHRP